MRLFAAIEMPESVIDEIAAWWQGACLHLPAAEWRDIPKQNWHLTLAFFGDVRGRDVDILSESLAACAGETKAIGLKLGHPGVFPGEQRARIFWLGVEDAFRAGSLRTFARCCRQAGRATLRKRTAKEEPFRGHITLARRRGSPMPPGAEILAKIPQPPAAKWIANRLTLFQSELHRDGARYRILEEFELPGACRI
ncbi:MAG: RNA 2',3'-cyclic phosphodiesterase [Mariprofundaceae bacterium]|nr:RNA 2',3'-cyclic phosphodiesterase [Mariprofundaceae bacterium]